jgi:DNA-binding transcriptional LysR family regulator
METSSASVAQRISLESLALLIAIADAGTITAAAKRLHLVPSVATRKIAALERAMETRLFDRTTRRIHLTEAGVAALAWARAVVEGFERLSDELSVGKRELSGSLRLVLNEYLGTVVLPPFLADFSRRHPGIVFDIELSDALVPADARDYDVAVHSGRVPDSALKGVRIRLVHRVLCASPDYLQREGVPLDLASLARHKCLAHRQQLGGTWAFRHKGRTVRQAIRPVVVANSYLPLIELARAGMGIILVSDTAVWRDLESGRLVRILPDHESIYSDGEEPAVWALYPDGRMLKRVRVFLQELSGFLKEHS